MMHSALECWLKTRDILAVMNLITELANDQADLDEFDISKLIGMMRAYIARYAEDDFDVLALEDELILPIKLADGTPHPEFYIAGKVDGVGKLSDGNYIIEHKSTATLNQGYIERIWTDAQLLTYAIFYPQWSKLPIRGAIYDILGKPGVRPKKNETPKEYEQRCFESTELLRETIFFTRQDLQEFMTDLYEVLNQLWLCMRSDAWYKNTQFCFNWNRKCPYFDLCKNHDDKFIKENRFEIVPPHSELSLQLEDFDQVAF